MRSSARPEFAPRERQRHAEQGFTLLEVLVAIAILGLGLSVILGSQVGLFGSATRGARLTVATNLLRCKMSEVEAHLLSQGYQLTDETDEGPCCGDEDEDGYRCSWKIERVTLPDLSIGGDGGVGEGDGSGSSDGGLGALGALGTFAALGSNSADPSTGASAPATMDDLAQKFSGASSMSLAPMLMSLVYPSLKPMLEESIRKVTVTIHITEGKNEHTLDVVQYVTNPQQGDFGSLEAATGGAGSTLGGVPGATTGAGTPAGTSSPLGGLLSPFLKGAR